MILDKKMWLLGRKLRYFFRPPEKRVKLEIETDGRDLTYLLVSLHTLGYAIYIVKSPMLFRELVLLKKSTQIPFVFGGKERRFNLVISDQKEAIAKAKSDGIKSIFLDYDFFNEAREEFRMPYFMHPAVYYEGFHNAPAPNVEGERPVKLGFFGTRDAIFYTRDFHFPMMNREQILEVIFKKFEDQIVEVKTPIEAWEKQRIVVSLDSRGGDRSSKTFLTLREYLSALSKCDFILCPPGWCVPLSHNLIEGMAMGVIPILNSSEYLYPCLEHRVNCLSFSTEEELEKICDEALTMPAEQIATMRRNVIQYYDKYLKPGSWLANAIKKRCDCILVNAEELSFKKPHSYEY